MLINPRPAILLGTGERGGTVSSSVTKCLDQSRVPATLPAMLTSPTCASWVATGLMPGSVAVHGGDHASYPGTT